MIGRTNGQMRGFISNALINNLLYSIITSATYYYEIKDLKVTPYKRYYFIVFMKDDQYTMTDPNLRVFNADKTELIGSSQTLFTKRQSHGRSIAICEFIPFEESVTLHMRTGSQGSNGVDLQICIVE